MVVELELCPPPQPEKPAAHAISNENVSRSTRTRLALPKRGNKAKEQSHRQPAMAALSDGALLAVGAVLTVTVKLLLCPLVRFSELGATLQTVPVGAPEQVRVTAPVNPGDPVSERL